MVKIIDPKFDNASYIDPRGRVLHYEGGILRAFFPETAVFYKELLSSNKMATLTKQGRIIDFDFMPDIEIKGFSLVVRQREILNLNYCFEWSPTMLKDAALLTLDLAIDFCDDGIFLQDATPYNILFDSAKPTFIDLCSFTPAISGYIWSAYQQFCNFFLFPLYLFNCGDLDLTTQLMKNCNEGISAEAIIRIMSFSDKAKIPGYFARVFLPKIMSQAISISFNQTKIRPLLSHLMETKKKAELQKIRKKFFRGLKKDILYLGAPDKTKKLWSNYYQQTEQDVLQKKLGIIDSVTKSLNPKTVLDIGCNRGEFSILASKTGARVVAFDTDSYCIDMLYKKAKSENLAILSLVMDILNPTPGMGWRGMQFKNAQERFKSEMVYALALTHHLVFLKGLNFMRIIQSIKDFCGKWLIIEYISCDDPQVKLLPRRPSLDYSFYNQDNFLKALSEQFSEVSILPKYSDTRILFLAKV
jgi:SAM-dependent methyltransferase